MANKPVSRELAQQAADAVAQAGNVAAAARLLGIPRATMQNRVEAAQKMGLNTAIDAKDVLAGKLKRLEAELASAQRKALDDAAIRRHIIGLNEQVESTKVPAWMLGGSQPDSAPGVPTLFVSDLHWGEVVHPSQINGVNRYNLEIARRRLAAMAERAVRLLKIIDPKLGYPGIVVALGGDMISGNIHDELTASNEINSMPAVLDLFSQLAGLLKGLADKFGRVFVPCVTGNHGRDTRKIWSKDRHHTSFDWLLYCFLAKHFEGDKRISFLIPDGPDAYFRIYGHRYLLTHGDQFRGGDGMIGALGPIIRGDHKKRGRNAQIGMDYDTMLLGHWHQYIHLNRLIVNGSLKGMDEYAYSSNFPFEPPQQALWITHPKHGITFRMPVNLDDRKAAAKTAAWVSVKEAA